MTDPQIQLSQPQPDGRSTPSLAQTSSVSSAGGLGDVQIPMEEIPRQANTAGTAAEQRRGMSMS